MNKVSTRVKAWDWKQLWKLWVRTFWRRDQGRDFKKNTIFRKLGLCSVKKKCWKINLIKKSNKQNLINLRRINYFGIKRRLILRWICSSNHFARAFFWPFVWIHINFFRMCVAQHGKWEKNLPSLNSMSFFFNCFSIVCPLRSKEIVKPSPNDVN